MLTLNRQVISLLLVAALVCGVLVAPAVAHAAQGVGPTAGQAVVFGFEDGQTDGWVEGSSSGFPVISNEQANPGAMVHSGSWSAWLGGAYDDISYIEKTFSVPDVTPFLTFWQWTISDDACGGDKLSVIVNGKLAATEYLCTTSDSQAWQLYRLDLHEYVGHQATVRIQVETDSSSHSSFFVDDISLGTPFKIHLPLVR
jgi:hypothetical protein